MTGMETGSMLQYKCPCCGGAISFDSSAQKMKCPYCDTEFETETLKSYDEGLKEDRGDDMSWDTEGGGHWQEGEDEDVSIYICSSCGGEIITDETTSASSCPFCGNPVIFKNRLSGELKPDYVIPFKLDKKAAKAALKKHLDGKKLLPRVFKSENHIDEIKGVYVPFWLFDATADARVRYRATKTRVWSDANYNYTSTSFYNLFRSGSLGFEHIPVDGSAKMPDDLMESLEPFDFTEAVDFRTAYLSGYFADKYDVTAEESIARANSRIKASAEDALRDTVSPAYTSVIPENSSVRFDGGKASYALYPVWILNTTWNGRKYTFAMNGQTGKFVGDLPVDKGIYAKYFAAIAAVSAAIAYGLMWLALM